LKHSAGAERYDMPETNVERIIAEIHGLSPQERLLLIRTVVDTLITPAHPAGSRRLTFGEYRGARMSSEDDFKIAELRPDDREMNGR